MAFVRRFTSFPSIEVLNEIEAIDIVDLPPPAPVSGVGSGALLVFGEFEDGPFAVKGGDAADIAAELLNGGILEAFSSEDLRQKFGAFGFTYDGVPSGNPCARRHGGEYWNGNGFLKLKYLRPKRLFIARVDTSVGSVAFGALGYIDSGTAGPWDLAVGNQLSLTTSTGGPVSSTAITATRASALGVAGTFPTGFVGGESIAIDIDGGPALTVAFTSADSLAADVVARINLVLGMTVADVSGGQVRIRGLISGTDSQVGLADVTAGTLAVLGLTAGTVNGTGSVGNVDAVTAAELATIINGTAGLTAIDAAARALPDGRLRVYDTNPGTGSMQVNASTIATALDFTTAVQVDASTHPAGSIPAGTRVTDGVTEWVTMQTLVIPEGTVAAPDDGLHVVKVRPSTDDGTAVGAAALAVDTVTDQPAFAELSVTNANAISAALTEVQMDVAYQAAIDASMDLTGPAREANISISARQSTTIKRVGRQNAIDASEQGLFGRKFIASAPIGFSQSQAQTDVALYRSDRLWYTWPGWQVQIPEIAIVGTAGGDGFTDDGVITVRADGPLASLCCQLPPEDNPGQETGLIEAFFQVEPTSVPLGINAYKALKAAGICAPRRDRKSGSIYQSGVTSSLTPGLKTIARRKMADFIEDTIGEEASPYSKKTARNAIVDAIDSILQQFLGDLLSVNQPEQQRINSFSVDAASGNTPSMNAQGIFVWVVKVRTLASLDAIVFQAEIGEGVVTITEAA